MKKQYKDSVKILALASLLACPISSQAGVVENMNSAMTSLLGHAPAVTNVYEVERQGLNSGQPPYQPWSSSYWPDITGGITNHFRDRAFLPNLLGFLLKYNVSKKRFHNDHENVKKDYQSWSDDELNMRLSPAEKYDLLIGSEDFNFTKAVMDDIDFRAHNRKTSVMADGSENNNDMEGDDNTHPNKMFADILGTYAKFDDLVSYKYWKQKGASLAYWFGICDGWSPAAVTLPRPENPVTVTSASGRKITFYPDDLKALGSYLFARTNNDYMTTMNYQFAGRACGAGGDPEVNETTGRVKDFRCNDLDAGVWHMTLVNRIGMDKMGFVFEIDNNKKINNHPVSSYSFKYFSPVTGNEGSLKDSVVPLVNVKDSYANRRNPKAVYLVGVKSHFRYLNYQFSEKHHGDTWFRDSEGQDEFKEKEYTYDLELDQNGTILGGEWGDRSKDMVTDENGDTKLMSVYAEQPDFIWMSAPRNLPHSEQSTFTEMGNSIDMSNPRPFGNMNWAWDGKGPMPSDWIRAAKKDAMWSAPAAGKLVNVAGTKQHDVVPVDANDPRDPKDASMKSAQPLSNIVYFLFDKARNQSQK